MPEESANIGLRDLGKASWQKRFGPHHHFDLPKSFPVTVHVIVRSAGPGGPKDAVADPFVFLAIIFAVEVGGHAGIEPPPGAIVCAAAARGVLIVVPVRGAEELLVVVVAFVEVQGVPGCAAVAADGQAVFEVLVGDVELVVSGVLSDAGEVFQLNPQLHLLALGQQVNFVVPQPELLTVSKAALVLLPGPVEGDAAVLAHLEHCPATAEGFHVAVGVKAAVPGIRGELVDAVPPVSGGEVIGTVSLKQLDGWVEGGRGRLP